MKKLLVLSILLLAGCSMPAKEEVLTDNRNFEVERLFMVDGCDVYRFSDGLYSHYLTTCKGSTSDMKSCGKGCVYPEEIPTN